MCVLLFLRRAALGCQRIVTTGGFPALTPSEVNQL